MSQLEYICSEKYFENLKKNKNIVCFGAGGKLRQALVLLDTMDIRPTVICDNNSELWGRSISFKGKSFEIISYDEVKSNFEEYVILLTMSIRNAIETNQMLRQKGEGHSIFQFCNPFKVDNFLIPSKDIDNNFNNFQDVYEKFADDTSRKLFELNLNYKLTGDMFDLYQMTEGNTFFDEAIIGGRADSVYIDIGAYTGDTILKYLEYCGGKYKYIYAFEADRGNYDSLHNFIRYGRVDRVTLFNQALWSEKDKLNFYSITDNSEINYDSPNLFRSIDNAIDNDTKFTMEKKGGVYGKEEIQVETLDNLLQGECPTIIKINALAADFQILRGSKKIIERCKPIIIMEHGVKPENVLGVINFLRAVRSDYSFYLRQKEIFGDSKTVMYAV